MNGDSGFIPRPFDRAMELLEHGLDEEALRFLRAVGVRHVVAPGGGGPLAPGGLDARGRRLAPDRVLEVEDGRRPPSVAAGRARRDALHAGRDRRA